ncbi:MAG: hypothetical protein L3K09_05435 [Thermoplasmata archaeon]|nr:hypothetical protein [Thermoplasmata archaeon]
MKTRTAALVAAAIVGVVVVVVVFQPFTPRPPPQVEVMGIKWTFDQGNTSQGIPWFLPFGTNDSGGANGFPIYVSSGATFTVSVYLANTDKQAHSLVLVEIKPPFRVASAHPAPPTIIQPGQDGWLEVGVIVDAPGGSATTGSGTLGFT